MADLPASKAKQQIPIAYTIEEASVATEMIMIVSDCIKRRSWNGGAMQSGLQRKQEEKARQSTALYV